MRATILLGAVLAFSFLDAAAQTPIIGQRDVARPGGVYATLRSSDAAACARLCAEDGICMAWTYREAACELKAVVPQAIVERGAISGLSSRAPDFSRRLAAIEPVADVPALPDPDETPLAAVVAVADAGDLLGGPVAAPPLPLRPRMSEEIALRR